MSREIKRTLVFLKDKRTHFIYGEEFINDIPPFFNNAKVYVAKHALRGKRPEKIEVHVIIPD